MSTPILVAYRGGALEAPENTLAAFRYAISLGVGAVELDVRMSSDGELVVIHDETLERTTNGSGRVRERTFEELRRLDAGSWFGDEYAGERIPSLREALNVCAGAVVGAIVELKSPHLYPGMERKVVSLVGEMWLLGVEDVWCISFDHEAIRRMRAMDAGLQLGYLFPSDVPDFARADDAVQGFFPFYRSALERPEEVERAHRLGKFVYVWTVNEEEDVRRAVEVGVDGILSDRPSMLGRVVRRKV